ncbi:RND family efflux transporter MFP subunit [Rhizobium sp. SLBN-94]|nr:RND family efflux transporter MFP subunit [Rhizobium sp. SLBN-94]
MNFASNEELKACLGKSRPAFIRASIALVSLFLLSAVATLAQIEAAPTAKVELASVDVTTVAPRRISNEVRISGSLTPIRRSSLTARVAGTIVELPVQVGDVVKKGDLLVRLDTEALRSALTARRAEVDAINAQLELAESILARNISLGERGVTSEAARLEAQSQVLNLRAQLRSKQAEVADAQRSLDDAEVHAEFDGVISVRPAEQGQTVPVNSELLTVVDLSRMEVDAGVPTSRIPRVQVGQPVELSVEGFPERTFQGEVTHIAPTAVASSRAVRVFLAIQNGDGLLKGGMFTTGILKVDDQENVIALPTPAIRHDGSGAFVLKIVDGHLRRQEVKLGTTWSDQDLVGVKGLTEGDVVVTALLPQLVAGAPVAVEGL